MISTLKKTTSLSLNLSITSDLIIVLINVKNSKDLNCCLLNVRDLDVGRSGCICSSILIFLVVVYLLIFY